MFLHITCRKWIDMHFTGKVWNLSYMTFKPVAGHLLNPSCSEALTVIIVFLVWKFSNSDTCAKEERDNLRTLFMHFISINVLLAQDQKDGENLNFLMKVISSSFIPILRVICLCMIREWMWELSLWREMSYPRERGKLEVSQSRNLSEQRSISSTRIINPLFSIFQLNLIFKISGVAFYSDCMY